MAHITAESDKTNKALLDSYRDLDRIQEVAQIGWWRLDTQRNVLTWSDQTYRIFGIPKESSLTYKTFLKMVFPDDSQYINAQWKAALHGEPYDEGTRMARSRSHCRLRNIARSSSQEVENDERRSSKAPISSPTCCEVSFSW
jgi:PAS domain-containing protein